MALKVLRKRFGDESVDQLTRAVHELEDLESLEQLFDHALSETGLDEFRTALMQHTPPLRRN